MDVLPYRTDMGSLAALIEARARGRGPGSGLRGKALEGTTVAAERLGLLDPDSRALTERGRRFALADEAGRSELLGTALRELEPYAALLREVEARGERVTDAEWMETWWGTRGYGNSPSNRQEGAVAFGRFAEAVGLGRFVPGRRGHRSRIEWRRAERPPTRSEPRRVEGVEEPPRPPPVVAAEPLATGAAEAERPEAAVPAPGGGEPGATLTRVRLVTGDIARLELPQRLPRREKERLLALVAALIEEE